MLLHPRALAAACPAPLALDAPTAAALAAPPPLSAAADAALKAAATAAAQAFTDLLFAEKPLASEDGLFARIPNDSDANPAFAPFPLPRAKHVPAQSNATRWERFAAAKGIQKKKKSRMVYDEASGSYKSAWGYTGGKKDPLKDWIMEVPDNADPMEDQFQKKNAEKRERVQKNQMQQRRNKEEAVAASQGRTHKEARRAHLHQLIAQTKTATASVGRFDAPVENERSVKIRRDKRKFESSTRPERDVKVSLLKIAEDASNPKPASKNNKRSLASAGNGAANAASNASLNLRKSIHQIRSTKRSRK